MFQSSIDDHLSANVVRVANVVQTEKEKQQRQNHRNEVREQQEEQTNGQRHRQEITRIARWILQHRPARDDRQQVAQHRQAVDEQMSEKHTAAVQRVDIVMMSDLQVSTDVQSQENVALQEIEIVVENGFGVADDRAKKIGHTDRRPAIGVEREESNQQAEIGDEIGIEPLHGGLSHGWIGDELDPEEEMGDGGERAEIEERLDSARGLWRPEEEMTVGEIVHDCVMRV